MGRHPVVDRRTGRRQSVDDRECEWPVEYQLHLGGPGAVDSRLSARLQSAAGELWLLAACVLWRYDVLDLACHRCQPVANRSRQWPLQSQCSLCRHVIVDSMPVQIRTLSWQQLSEAEERPALSQRERG